MIKLNRIGNKLGLVGVVGVVLAGAMLVNQVISETAIEVANKQAHSHQGIAVSTVVAREAIRRMQLGVRDMRLSGDAQETEKAFDAVIAGQEAATKQFDMAIAAALKAENRERLQKIKSLVADYVAKAGDIKRDQARALATTSRRNDVSADWDKSFAAMLALPAMTSARNRLEIEKTMYEADSYFAALGAATWRFASTEEPNQLEVIEHKSAALADAIGRLRTTTDERSLSVTADRLAADNNAFSGYAKEVLQAQAAKRESVAAASAIANQTIDLLRTGGEAAEKLSDEANAVAANQLTSASHMSFMASIAVILILVGSVMFTFFGVARPLTFLNGALARMAGGELDIDIPGAGRGDEVGDIAKTVVVIRENAERKARDEAEAQARQEQIAVQQRKADMIKLADRFEAAVGEIVETVSSASTELEASAGALTITAERSQQLATTVAAASEEASTNVQSVASATEQLSSSVNEISRQVQESARMANEAVEQARQTNDRVSDLSKAASRIGDVVELINTIAGQTNLLALNATIEAARAGESGRGFAVVASEVKALAEQTAKATGEIGQQISGIQSATEESVVAIKAISGTIEKLSEISSTIAAAVEEQGAATQEISRNVQQAAHGTQQVSANITDVQRGASETGSASSQVLSAAQMLSGDSNRLKLEVSNFLNTVRAA